MFVVRQVISKKVGLATPATVLLAMLCAPAKATTDFPTQTLQAQASCEHLLKTNSPSWKLRSDDSEQQEQSAVLKSYTTESYQNVSGQTGTRYIGTLTNEEQVVWTRIENDEGLQSIQISTSDAMRPQKMWQFDPQCEPTQHRELIYKNDAAATDLHVFDVNDGAIRIVEPLNPEVPKANAFTEKKLPLVRVAIVDSGVNYTLPEINNRLARSEDGELIGYDFWEDDALPFDAHFGQSAFHVIRYGTSTASVLLNESAHAELVPYRHPRRDITSMAAMVKHASQNDVRVVGLPFGSDEEQDWGAFAAAAAAQPNILFIASAGTDGRNIDNHPVYPAALDIPNLLVVTSADDLVTPAERANWGRTQVDYMLPAQEQDSLNFAGQAVKVSGANFAVPRAMALAIRMLVENPDWNAQDLIIEFALNHAEDSAMRYVRGGYIADPLASEETSVELLGVQTLPREKVELAEGESSPVQLPLSVFVLHDEWTSEQLNQSLYGAEEILQQCNIVFNAVNIMQLSVPDYLRDLSIGTAKTLTNEIQNENGFKPIRVFFTRNNNLSEPTDGAAFSRSSSRGREWLQDSVWLAHEVEAPGAALAHELFHVLANSGGHSLLAGNLMLAQTSAEHTIVLPAQCEAAIKTGKENELLFD